MKRWEKWLFHISTIAVAVSGLMFFWMKYLMENDDPFSIVNHPWQSGMINVHVIVAPVLVFVTGLIVQSHIRKKLESGSRPNRSSGVVSIFTLPLMIVSGYLLQIVSSPLLAQIVLVLHMVSSSAFMVTYAAHQIGTFRIRKSAVSTTRQSLSRRQLA